MDDLLLPTLQPPGTSWTHKTTMVPSGLAPPTARSSDSSNTMAACALPASTNDNKASPEKQPIRNLTRAFEALCTTTTATADATDITTPDDDENALSADKALISPTAVTDLPTDDSSLEKPPFLLLQLHPDLARELSPHTVQRVSQYSLVHDVNKEAAALSSHDPMVGPETTDPQSPLVTTVLGTEPPTTTTTGTMPAVAVIDEEQWLLSAVANRTVSAEINTAKPCPATFLQAMGEQEYESAVRTQLWKPSRSWWEAKSGKNPWIEPASHNKRWRYLWPLIHYHKFLAKCIKKLKRNGVEVKQSVSPVSVFLREEVCAVSDHLAAVSLFGSDEWMACLKHFTGWIVTTPEAEKSYRAFVSELPLRSVQEPGDVNSPLLRSQIDENFLRTMVAQREQMRETAMAGKKPPPVPGASKTIATDSRPPPAYPRSTPVPKQIHGVRRPRYYGWWNGTSWEQTPPPGDTSSVHSGLSYDSYPHPPQPPPLYNPNYHNMYPHTMYPMPYHAPIPPNQPPYPPSDQSQSTAYNYPSNNQMQYLHDWGMDPQGMYYGQPPMMDGYYPLSPYYNPQPPDTPVADTTTTDSEPHTPQDAPKDSSPATTTSAIKTSPYWAHLDQATLAMGLATPAKTTPSTPRRKTTTTTPATTVDYASQAQAPLVRQHYYYAGHEYAPPSPATQFMMSPPQGGGRKYPTPSPTTATSSESDSNHSSA